MKKIIATVLAMVMALALCTTAFAADPVKHLAKSATATNPGWDTYYVNSDSKYVDKDGNLLNDTIADCLAAGGFYKISLNKIKAAADVTCTAAGYAVDVYNGQNGKYYAKKADVDDADIATGTLKYIGTSFADTVAYYEYAAETLGGDNKTDASHYLYKTDDVYGKSEAPVYKCAVCGATFVLTTDVNTTKDDVSKLAKIDYTYVAADANAALVKAHIDTDKALKTSATLYVLTKGTAPSTTGTKPSPKTFDAGIALYAAMALTSVAGSAVVIGKKKEF